MSKSTEEGYHLRGQRGQFKESVNCFLCLKLVRSPHPSPTSPPGCDGSTLPKKEVIDKMTLQALFRYLNVDGKDDLQKEVSSNEGKAGDKKETVDRRPDVSLLLCKGCSLVTGELTKLVEQLKHTKIWINHWMRQLVDILSRSTTGPKSRKKKRRLSDDPLTSLLRAETKKKCMYKLEKTDFPRVCLERHDDDSSGFGESGKESSVLIPPDLIKEEHEEEEENGNDNLMEEMKQAQAHHESIDDIHVGPVVHVKHENFTLTPTSRIRVIMACPYCDETVTSNSGLNRHTAAFHPEQFLSSVKSAELSEQQFKSICQNLLSKLCQVKIIDKKIGCPYCPVTSGNRVYLKAHLIHGHQPILLRKLELLQNGIEETDRPEDVSTDTPSLQLQPKSLTNLISQPQRPRKNFYCRYCTKVCITQWSLKRHVLLSHRSSSSTSMPSIAKNIPTTKTVKNSCEHCGEKISTCYLKKHQEKCLASLKELESPSGPSTNQLPIQPHLAERKLKARKDKALPLDVVSWQCMECDRSFATLDLLDSHRNLPNCSKELEDSPDARNSFKCSECEANFWHLASLGRHRKKCHPDPSSRGNRPAYYKELKLKDPKIIPCQFCGRLFNSEDSLRRHMKTVCKSAPPEFQNLAYSPPMLHMESKASSSESFKSSQGDSGFNETKPIVVPGNDLSVGYYNEDNDYDGNNTNMVPDYDPLM